MGFIPRQKSKQVINRKALQRMDGRRVVRSDEYILSFLSPPPAFPYSFAAWDQSCVRYLRKILIAPGVAALPWNGWV